MSKLLKKLQRSGLVTSTRGSHGGYQLARPAARSPPRASSMRSKARSPSPSAAAQHSTCGIESNCRVGHAWQRVNARDPARPDRHFAGATRGHRTRSTSTTVPLTRLRRAVARVTPHRIATMASNPQNDPHLEALVGAEVPARLRHRHRVRHGAARPGRGRHPADLAQEGRARVHARVAAEGLPPLADDAGAALGARAHRADRLPGDLLLLGAASRRRTGRRAWTRSTRSCSRPTRSSAFRCTSARGWPAWRWTRCSTACRWPPPSRRRWRKAGVIFCSFSEAVQKHPELVEQYLGTRGAVHRQLLRHAQLGGVHRRLVRVTCPRACAARWSCRPTSASTPPRPASSSAR